MCESGGHNRHDETHVGQGFSASSGANVRTGDVNFYGGRFRDNQRKSLLELLHFPEIRSRESAIECEHDDTCTWLIDTPEYATWRADVCSEPRHRMLWIKGKPGAGKSTMMKFADKQSRRLRSELVLPHFFNARGTPLEHSTEGMYRTLLSWLLKEFPKEPLEELESQYQHHDERTPWQIPELVDILKTALEKLADRPVTFYIDALDECPQNEIRDMLKVFRTIIRARWSSGQQVRVCFASRPYPTITFTEATFLDFRDQEGHLKDMRQYIDDELQIGTSPLAKDLRRDVLKKAEGSFMWLTLVVRLLNIDSDGGHVDKLRQRLQEVPSGLNELYAHILKRYPDNHNALLACCQWLIFSYETEVYTGIQRHSIHLLWWVARQKVDKDEEQTRRLYDTLSNDDMKRYIFDIFKGLIEFRADRSGTIYPQFLHESAREFVLSSNDLWNLCGAQNDHSFKGLSHEALRDSCLRILESERSALQSLVETHRQGIPSHAIYESWVKRRSGRLRHPLALYAAKNIICHAEAAQKLGFDQTPFLRYLNQRCGPYFLHPGHLLNPMSHDTRPVKVLRSMIAYLFAAGAGTIIRETQLSPAQHAWNLGRPFGLIEDAGQMSPVKMVVDDPSRRGAVNALVDIYLRFRPRSPGLQVLLDRLALYCRSSWHRGILLSQPPLLYVATRYPNLGSFLLLALAADEVLDPHVSNLKDIFDATPGYSADIETWEIAWARGLSCFLRVLHLFLDQGLSSIAIDFGYQEILEWIDLSKPEYNIPDVARRLYQEPKGMIEELVRIRLIC